MPVPDKLTVCWLDRLFKALSVNVTVPVNTPPVVGEKATAIAHPAPAVSCVLELQSLPPDGCCE